jgi:hypothetical protein
MRLTLSIFSEREGEAPAEPCLKVPDGSAGASPSQGQLLVEPDPRRRLGSAGEALALLRPLRAAGVPATVPPKRAPAAPLVDALERLARRLGARGFAIERGGELGQTALAWRARHDGRGIPGGPVQVTAVSAAVLGAIDRPLPPIQAALLVQAVAGVDIESGGGLRGWLDGKPLAIPLIGLGEHGVDPRAREHVVHSLRESDLRVVIPVLLAADATIDVLTPRSLLAGDREGHLERVRRLLAPVD